MKHTLTVTYWLVAYDRPPFADEHSPSYVRLTSLRGSESFGYRTAIGYARHVATIRADIASRARIITEYRYVPNGNRVIVYRPTYERGPHAAPHAVVIPPCAIESE